MAGSLRTVALICGNPALASILSAALAADRTLRVRSFETVIALAFYARIAPVELIVADLDDGSFDPELLETCDLAAGTPVIGIASQVAATEAVDELIAKPMSPRYLLERVLSRLASRPAPLPPLPRRGLSANVVPLFRP